MVKRKDSQQKTAIREMLNGYLFVMLYRPDAYCEAKRPGLRSKTATFRF